MFGHPSRVGPGEGKRMFAYLPESGATIEMILVENAFMAERQRLDIQGVPVYYTEDGRYWPKPLPYVVITREV